MTLISVVTGTFQRLESLQRMIRSARENMAESLSFEFVVVDGGSTDGTIQWCSVQKDVKLIQHGALLGAIRAFTDGAYSAAGEYVILANDDVAFLPGSISAALVHLESHPRCGAVAFMDNRPGPSRPSGAYAAQTMQARHGAQSVRVVYAQVGMYRQALGDTAGWWGADGVMKSARTYGGDNFLSAKLWEMGYTVDVARGALVQDHVIADDMRRTNVMNNDTTYNTVAYPQGPLISSQPLPLPFEERMRILYLPVYERLEQKQRQTKRGLREALSRRALVWEWDYLDESNPAMSENLQGFAPHLIMTQFHDGERGQLVDQLRALCPAALLVNWNGDARGLTDEKYIELLKKFDMQLVLNAAALPVYQTHGIRAAYWQIGYEPRSATLPDAKAHDVVFLGTCYSQWRRDIEQTLNETGLNVGLYGKGWKRADGDTIYDFDAGAAIYARAKAAVSDAFADDKTEVYGFVSNRFFEALASGVTLFQQAMPGLDEFNGCVAGKHYIPWETLDELRDLIVKYTKDYNYKLDHIAVEGQEFVLNNFSFDRQVDKLFTEILPLLERAENVI